MSTPYQFSVTKSRMIQLGFCVGAIQLLLYGAGVATGVLVGPSTVKLQEKIRPASEIVAEKDRAPAKTAPATPSQSAPGAPSEQALMPSNQPAGATPSGATPSGATPSAATPTAITPTNEREVAAGKQPALAAPNQPGAPEPVESPQLGSHLAVQVASFHDKDNALRLAAVLKRQGFGPVTVGQYDSRNQTWHFVRLGPFRAWEDASRVAAELDRSYDLRAYVLPTSTADN